MEKLKTVLVTILVLFLVSGCSFFTFTPMGRGLMNTHIHTLKKVDDRTLYETRKKVEDTCRASIASYLTDKATYEQYKNSDSELERSWANQAKMRANKTANIYNEYILKNSYVFEGNVPNDIDERLEIVE